MFCKLKLHFNFLESQSVNFGKCYAQRPQKLTDLYRVSDYTLCSEKTPRYIFFYNIFQIDA